MSGITQQERCNRNQTGKVSMASNTAKSFHHYFEALEPSFVKLRLPFSLA